MNEETIYWIWLARTLGAGARIADIIEYFGSPRKLYEAGKQEWRVSGLLSARQITKLSQFSPSQSGDILKACRENGWEIVTPSDIEYPTRLLEISDYPAVLFVQGDVDALTEPVMLSIVGTRKSSSYSVRVTEILSAAFAKAGAMVISGGALGIDSAAHWGAMQGGGKTIAVLGCGLGTNYLQENEAMRREIAKHGAVITEFLPFTPAGRNTFPMRNRIISGLSLGTVVIEAGERSGSLITARLALEQGRDVFAVPGDIISSAFTGTNRLLRDGAKPVFTALDVLEEYYYTFPDKLNLENTDLPLGDYARKTAGDQIRTSYPVENRREKPQRQNTEIPPTPIQRTLPEGLTANAKKIYDILGSASMHIDEISEKAELSTPQTLAALTELELFALVELNTGKHYQKI